MAEPKSANAKDANQQKPGGGRFWHGGRRVMRRLTEVVGQDREVGELHLAAGVKVAVGPSTGLAVRVG